MNPAKQTSPQPHEKRRADEPAFTPCSTPNLNPTNRTTDLSHPPGLNRAPLRTGPRAMIEGAVRRRYADVLEARLGISALLSTD